MLVLPNNVSLYCVMKDFSMVFDTYTKSERITAIFFCSMVGISKIDSTVYYKTVMCTIIFLPVT